jgi:hypothetical protein
MERRALGLITVGFLAALFVLVVTVPIGGTVGTVLFAIVIVLLGVLFFRFGPDGDVWGAAEQLGINPWLFVLLILVGAVVWMAFRIGLLGLSA